MVEHFIKLPRLRKGKDKMEKQTIVKMVLVIVWAAMLVILVAVVVPKK